MIKYQIFSFLKRSFSTIRVSPSVRPYEKVRSFRYLHSVDPSVLIQCRINSTNIEQNLQYLYCVDSTVSIQYRLFRIYTVQTLCTVSIQCRLQYLYSVDYSIYIVQITVSTQYRIYLYSIYIVLTLSQLQSVDSTASI